MPDEEGLWLLEDPAEALSTMQRKREEEVSASFERRLEDLSEAS
jgi:hypothetical protein